MEKALTKYFWVLNLVMIAAISALLANGFGEVVATTVSDLLPAYKDKPKVATKYETRKKAYKPDGTRILERNMFDSVTGPIYPPDPDEGDYDPIGEEPIDMDGLPVVPCTSSRLKIMVIMADKDDQKWSFASVNDGSENKIIRVGDKVENRTVAGISRRYLFLSNPSEICYLDMFSKEKPAPARGKKPRGVATKKDLDFKSGVQVISETERIVDRSLVDKVLASPEKFVRSVRVRAQRKDGKITGYKLRRFRKNSPLALLGAKKDDIIHSVNGNPLSGAEQALNLYSSLRSENDLVFSITRKGKPMELNIKVR